MKPFDEFWSGVLAELDKPRQIRNWTAYNGYAVGGKFVAQSFRSLDPVDQYQVTRGYPIPSMAETWIVCSQLIAPGYTGVSRKEFEDRYGKWRTYRINGMTRKAFDGETKASPYVIALFKEFDTLTG